MVYVSLVGGVIIVGWFGLVGYPSVLDFSLGLNYPSMWDCPGGKRWGGLMSFHILVCCVILPGRVRLS